MISIRQDELRRRLNRETEHLLSSPANAAYLREAIRAADAGELEERELIQGNKPSG